MAPPRPVAVDVVRVFPRAAARLCPDSGGVLWLTGLSGAGKTTLAGLLSDELRGAGAAVEILDGDEMRRHLTRGLGFSRDDRDENVRRIGFVAAMLARHRVWAIVAAISPYRDARAQVREMAAERGLQFLEVYVRCPLAIAEQRDPKQLYRRARLGEIACFTGLSDPYEEPLSADIVVDTSVMSPDECARAIFAL